MTLSEVLADLPLVAILRGITPTEAVPVADALYEVGFRCLEIPLNPPDPFASIAAMVGHLGDRELVGAGTVLSVEDVARRRCRWPDRDFAQLRLGRDPCDQDSGSDLASRVLHSERGVPRDRRRCRCAETVPRQNRRTGGTESDARGAACRLSGTAGGGGIDASSIPAWLAAGARGFGIGASLYAPGRDATAVAERGTALRDAYTAARTQARRA